MEAVGASGLHCKELNEKELNGKELK